MAVDGAVWELRDNRVSELFTTQTEGATFPGRPCDNIVTRQRRRFLLQKGCLETWRSFLVKKTHGETRVGWRAFQGLRVNNGASMRTKAEAQNNHEVSSGPTGTTPSFLE